MAEKITWKENVGQIHTGGDTESFWLFPTDFFFNKKLCITSPWFSHEDETWRLVKMPSDLNPDYLTIYVWRKARQNSVTYTFNLSLKSLDNNMTPIASRTGEINSEFGYEYSDFCSLSYLKCCVYSRCGLSKLSFAIQKNSPIPFDPVPSIATVSEEDSMNADEEHEKTKEPEPKGIERLAENLKQLLLSEENSDVVLKAEQREFQVHKTILTARSPVFASMFQHDMKEKKSGIVDIPDCTAEAFEVFLLYVYTGRADTMSRNNVFNLYYAADKYRIDDLKEECVDYMMGILSVETVCDVIALSLKHGESKLLKEATRFFRENIKETIKTVEWQKYMVENPTHANELLIKALNP